MADLQEDKRLYIPIKEVAAYMGVNTSTLRYWEKQFDQLNPRKNGKGDRLYTKKDILLLKNIYNLVKEQGYKIEAAKNILSKRKPDGPDKYALIEKLEDVKAFLRTLRKSL
ncbi:MAG: MerR family transcriptional regulator [Saprospiraceae bacterium]|nr:MerR family transcriptional regulator [Saprospiraceae bacterium]